MDAAGDAQPRSAWRWGDIVAYLITLLLLLWPLIINHRPFYFADTPSYLRGGDFGFNTGLRMLEQWLRFLFGASSASQGALANDDARAAVTIAIGQAGGARSLIYSVATYLLRAPGTSLTVLALAQAGAVALVICRIRSVIAPKSGLGAAVAVAAAAALLTSAAWYAVYASPDILAGVVIGASLLLTVFFDRLTVVLRLLLVVLVAFSVTTHGSHLPIALSVLVTGAAAQFWLRRVPLRAMAGKTAWFVSPLLLAVGAQLTTSYMAFGEASMAPKRYPILLARSVADGPGAWHLQRHCATERYAICELFGSNPPRKVGTFLWSKNGVRYRATPEQMDRIRAEESLIVRRAALEFPVEQISRSLRSVFAQTFTFGLGALRFGTVLKGTKDPVLIYAGPDRPVLRAASNAAVYLAFGGSVLMLLAVWRRLERVEIAALAVAVTGLLANAAVCGILSGVTDRYQGRVAWILPVLAFAIALRIFGPHEERGAPT